MAETETVNLMPVEVAIQRELAFRKKLSSNPLFHSHGFVSDEFMPLQTPSSIPTTSVNPMQGPGPSSLSGTSPNLIPDSSFRVPPPYLSEAPTPVSNLYPRGTGPIPSPSQARIPSPYQASPFPNQYPRPRPFSAPYHIPPQYSGSRPGLNFRPSPSSGINRMPPPARGQFQPTYHPRGPRPSQNSSVTVDEQGTFFCNVCQVPCSGPVNLKDHLRGHKHKAKLQFFQLSRKHSTGGIQIQQQIQPQSSQKRCEVCQIWCTDVESLKMHLRGQKHQAKMQEMENGMKSGAEKEIPRPWCELCNIWCIDEPSYHQHLKGKKHITNLHAVEQTKRAKVMEHQVINLE